MQGGVAAGAELRAADLFSCRANWDQGQLSAVRMSRAWLRILSRFLRIRIRFLRKKKTESVTKFLPDKDNVSDAY